MADYEDRVKSVEEIIRSGYIRHDEIAPALEKAGLTQIPPDDISDLVKKYKYNKSWWARGKIAGSIKGIVDKIGSYASAIIGAGVIAEIVAAREFADSLIGDKLQGFGDNLLYWLGLKTIPVTGPEMMKAMVNLIGATPEIVKGMAVGIAVGYIAWKVITRVIGYLLKRGKRKRDIKKLLDHYSLANE